MRRRPVACSPSDQCDWTTIQQRRHSVEPMNRARTKPSCRPLTSGERTASSETSATSAPLTALRRARMSAPV